MFVPISAFLLFLVFGVACGGKCAHFWSILAFYANFATIKKCFPKKSNPLLYNLPLFGNPKLDVLGLLNPKMFKKTHTHRHPPTQTDRYPAYFATREPQCGALRNIECYFFMVHGVYTPCYKKAHLFISL